MIRFRLRTLLLAFVPVAAVCFSIHDCVHYRPLHWERYDRVELQAELNQGHVVMVYVQGIIGCGRRESIAPACRDPRVVRFARAHNVKPLRGLPGHSFPGQPAGLSDVLLVYRPDEPRYAQRFDIFVRPEELLQAIR